MTISGSNWMKAPQPPRISSPMTSPIDTQLLPALANGQARPESIAKLVADRPALLADVFAGLGERQTRVKFGCAKVLLLVSERNPGLLQPHWKPLLALLDSENKILQWSALLTLGNLAATTPRPRVKRLLPRVLAPIRGPVMITAANAMRSAVQVALAHPPLADTVAQAILEVERATYQTEECRNVAIGHAITLLDRLLPLLKDRPAVVAMVQRQAANSRNATRKKAAVFLKKHRALPEAPCKTPPAG